MQLQKSEQQNQYNYVSSLDFTNYLNTLQQAQRNELYILIENHPKIQIINKQIIKYYRSTDNILKQLQYLIQYKKRCSILNQSQTSQQSYMTQQLSINVHFIVDININHRNYLRIIRDIFTIKIFNTFVYQLELIQIRQKSILSQLEEQPQSFYENDNKLIMTNLCQNVSKIFLVFKDYQQLIELQALIDVKWRLQSIEEIIQTFQKKKLHFFQISDMNKVILFFKKLITNVNNRLKNSCIIVIKNHYLSQLRQYSSKLKERVKVAINQNEFSFQNYQIRQMKLLQPQQSINPILQHVRNILTKNHISFHYQDYPIDAITNYNIVGIESIKHNEIILIKPNVNNKKEFVYFLFYNVLMEIVRSEGGVQLVERKMSEEINNKIYKNSLQQVKRHCIKNKILYFYLPQVVQFCKNLKINNLKKIKDNDRNRLLYYKHKLSKQNYKIQVSPEIQLTQSYYLLQNYQKAFVMKFQSQLLLKKIGLIKSQDIIKKFRQNGLGCIQAKIDFCKILINKYLQEDNKNHS